MSHFSLYVISPDKPEDPNDYVAILLAPFDENQEVDSYQKDCYCVGSKTRKEAAKQAEKELGSISNIRDQFWKEIHDEVEKQMGGRPNNWVNSDAWYELRNKVEKNHRPSWEERINPILEREQQLIEKHPLRSTADQACEECHGSGKETTTYNPKSKWDWWTIGGRWTGHLCPDYDPTIDPRNFEDCYICGGTGQRNDELGQAERLKDSTYSCNGCKGSGKVVASPSRYVEPPKNGNIAPVSQVLKSLDEGHDLLPFAILRPTGEWLEKGSMGWWGIVSDEKDEWQQTARLVLEEYPKHWIIVVDCHI